MGEQAVRPLKTIFGDMPAAEEVFSIDFASNFLTDQGKIDDPASFHWPPAIEEALNNSKFADRVQSQDFVEMCLVMRKLGIWLEDIQELVEAFDHISEIRQYLAISPGQICKLICLVILPGVDGHNNKMKGDSPDHFVRKLKREASIQRLYEFLTVKRMTEHAVALPPASQASGGGELAILSTALTSLGEGLKGFVTSPDAFECPSDKYTKLLTDYCVQYRDGVFFTRDVIPTRALLGFLMKQKDASTFDAVPLKLCHPAYRFDAKELQAQSGQKKIQIGTHVGAAIPFSLSDFERTAVLQDFVQYLKVLGTAYNVLGVIDQVTWNTHMEQVSEKLRQFPTQWFQIKNAEFSLRQNWAMHMREKQVSFVESVKHFQQDVAGQLFWLQACYMAEGSRFDFAEAKGPGKGSVSRGQKRAWSPPGRYTGAPSPVQNAPNNQKIAKVPRNKGGKSSPAGPRYNGPLIFMGNDHGDKGRICFAGCTTQGCPRGAACTMKLSHGVCPLPGCKGQKHCCETTHPELWRAFRESSLGNRV